MGSRGLGWSEEESFGLHSLDFNALDLHCSGEFKRVGDSGYDLQYVVLQRA